MLEVAIQKRLEGFFLDVAFATENKLVVLFGPSGAGKSLTMRAIAGTFEPEEGCIIIDGQALYDSAQRVNLPPQARRIGYVPQHYALFPHLSVEENIGFGLRDHPPRERTRWVAEVSEAFGLRGLARRRPGQLSGGQQQRVALARALAIRPRVILLDEPFAALDITLRAALRREIEQLQVQWGVAIVTVTHDLNDAFALGRWVIVYDNGHVIQHGAHKEVFFRPATPRVAELVGIRNILSAVVERSESNTLWVCWHGHRIATAPLSLTPGDPVVLCIRPSQIEIVHPSQPADRGHENLLSGRIVRELRQMETCMVYVRPDGSTAAELELALSAEVYQQLSLGVEKQVLFTLRREALHVIAGSTDETSPAIQC